MSEHLLRLFSQWDDEKLVTEFNKKADYSSSALAVMEKLIEERGLQTQVDAMEEEKLRVIQQRIQEEEEEIAVEAYHYEKNLLGNTQSAKEYAQSVKNTDGVYYETILGKQSGYTWASTALFAIGSIPLMIGIVMLTMEQSFPLYNIIWLTLGISMSLLAIYCYRKTKVKLRLVESKKGIFIEIEEDAEVFCIAAPFSYYYFCGSMSYSVNHIPVNKNAVLHVVIHDALLARNFILREEVSSLTQSAPPDWPASSLVPRALEERTYSGYIGKRSNLFKLKRILDGLQEH